MQPEQIQAFLTKWEVSGAAERANAHLFIADLCDVLGVEHPRPKLPDEHANAYVFEKTIPSVDDTSNFIDCYKRGCFVLETKQGADKDGSAPLSAEGQERKRKLRTGHGLRGSKGWDTAMLKAREQAQRYARALPKEEIPDGRPPFILVVDVGHSIALYTDWSRMGAEYVPYPDPASYRILLKDLLRSEVRDTLHAVWTDPLSLDPGRRSAKVTREIADSLAKLARSLEGKHKPEHVAAFLMRCLFTMFSEDVDLLPLGSFTKLLGELKSDPATFREMLENLWGTMNTGGLSPILRKKIPKFNGGLFAHADAIELNEDHIQLLIEASKANWKDVEPAIFGTLLERALDPRERHKLGAHYTPRAYVERLVNPTVIEPLRAQWKSVQVAALQLAEESGDPGSKAGVTANGKAIAVVEKFLYELGNVRVLDPACGSGNFLYVTLELLKRLEGEVLNTLAELGQTYKLEYNTHTISPANFFGIELNPRAAAIAEQVLWIGFLQWQLRTHGNLHNLPEPIIKDLHNIECRDAVLDYDSKTEQRDASGQVVTRWDGHSTKPHPVTGEQVPDADARVPVYTYTKPRPAKWPQADYIVGNPPFIGNKRMRLALGDGYTDALRDAHTKVPESCDFVMYWWDHAGRLVADKKVKRFGFITTNSITQTFNRKIVSELMEAKKPISLAFAIPDHPWVDSVDGAAVRVAMTVCSSGIQTGQLLQVETEVESEGDEAADIKLLNRQGRIQPDLSIGASVSSASALMANEGVACNGVQLSGMGFVLSHDKAQTLGLGSTNGLEDVIKPFCNGRDLTATSRDVLVIDLLGYTENVVREQFPAVFQHILTTVKPERDQNNRESYRKNWWVFAEARSSFRPALLDLRRYIVTSRTAKHRMFSFVDSKVIFESTVVAIAIEDAFVFGVLSSSIHVHWAMATGGWLGVGNDSRYNHADCFVKFPFPACTPAQQEKIRVLGEQLDAHRKRQQALHPELTMTGMYNVLERVREMEGFGGSTTTHSAKEGTTAERIPPWEIPLSAKEKKIYEQGLVGILKQLHDELDAAVAEAYGWPVKLPTDGVLARLVALNAERAAEEAKGQVRWLRPEYQNPQGKAAAGKQATLPVETVDAGDSATASTASTREWPADLPAQAAALTDVLGTLSAPATVEDIAAHFEGKRTKKRLDEMTRLLETLAAVGRARRSGDGWANN